MPYAVKNSLNVGFALFRGKGGGPFTRRRVTLTTGQTLTYGLPLIKASGADTFEIAVAAPNASTTTLTPDTTAIAGFALEAITSSAAGDTIEIAVADNLLEFCFPILAQTTKSANTSYTSITGANSQPQDLAYDTIYNLGIGKDANGTVFPFVSSNSTSGGVKKVGVYGGDANVAVNFWPIWMAMSVNEAIQIL